MQHKTLPNRVFLWTWIKEQFPTVQVDVENTLRLPIGWFITQDGETYRTPYLQTMLEKLNSLYGTPFSTKHSRAVGYRYTIFWGDEEQGKQEKESAVQKQEEKETELRQEQKEEESLISLEAEDAVEEEAVEIDMDRVHAARAKADEKQQKVDLENYGRELGVELSRRKSFDNMLKDLREAVEK